MKLTDKIRNKIAKRRERKAKLQKFADVIEFAEHKGHKYISLSEGIVSGKFITSNGIGEASPAYIWKDNAGNVHIEGNLVVNGNITGCAKFSIMDFKVCHLRDRGFFNPQKKYNLAIPS